MQVCDLHPSKHSSTQANILAGNPSLMSTRYRFGNALNPHFITYTTVQWADALSRPAYKDIIMESLRHCIDQKGPVVHAYVIMSNHVHLIASAGRPDIALEDIMRDHKKFTSRHLIAEIERVEESRRSWLLWLFRSAAERNSNNKHYQFWQQDNHPIELTTQDMILQRLGYIHNNPVRAGLVWQPQDYVYSSALEYSGIVQPGRLPIVLL